MATSLEPLKSSLRNHRLYELIADEESVRFFMQRHVVCVWDFMSVVKSLQQDLAGTSLPWVPPQNPLAARLINEIMLDEESDDLPGGGYGSHYNLYLMAMDELGCDTQPMTSLIDALRLGTPLEAALLKSTLPEEALRFAEKTFELLDLPLHARAAVFLHGREEVIPQMFIAFVRSLRSKQVPCDLLLHYLERHIEVDGERHHPMAQKMMLALCGSNQSMWQEAEQAAQRALNARVQLWDTMAQQLETRVSRFDSRV